MASSDIIKIGFDYRASLEQFKKETNGVFDGISNKAGKQKITIQLDAKDDKVIDKIKELQKLKLDKFTFEFGDSGLKEQLQTFDKLENKINEIINLGKGKSFIDSSSTVANVNKITNTIEKLDSILNKSFDTKNKTEALKQLKDSFKNFNQKDLSDGFDKAGAEAGYSFWKSYEEAINKGVAESRLNNFGDIKSNKYALFDGIIDDYKYVLLDYKQIESEIAKNNSNIIPSLDDSIIKDIDKYVYALYRVREAEKQIAEINEIPVNQWDELGLEESLSDSNRVKEYYQDSANNYHKWILSQIQDQIQLQEELKETREETQKTDGAFSKPSVATNNSQIEELKSDIQEVKTELGDVKDRISSIESNGFENVRDDVEKTKESVKELNNELTEMKTNLSSTPQAESNISSDISSQVKVSDSITDQIVANEKKKQEAYKATTETVMYHAGVISKLNKAETNGRFYGSDRGTGYFGTGHYFVDNNTKHELDNNSNYSSLPYTSIDISKYDNLFKATTDEVADALHTFLKNLTKFTQGSDSFDVSELFSQFQKVFGETTMDMQEFDARLSQLKAYMQNSNMSDRGDSVSTQFMKSLGYGGVDTRGTKYADTRYGTVIYDLKEESVLQANITDELQKQGQMLEKINYEKGQVFDKSEDTRIQGILDQQAKAKEIETEFNKIFDSTNLNAYESELDSINQKLTENQNTINNCSSAIENADEDARRFAKEMADFDFHMSDEEITETANKNKVEYQECIDELNKEQSLLKARKQELESNLDAEYKLANAARERATATVEDRMKDVFPDQDVSASVESATNFIKEENNVLDQNTQKVKENTQAKEQNSNINLNKYDKSLDSYNSKLDKYQSTINRFKDGGWTSDTYLKNVQAVRDAVKEYETLLNELKGEDASLVTNEDIEQLNKYEKTVKDTIATVQNMSAAEKGYNFVSGQKEMDKIHKILAEHSRMSSEAKAQIKAYYKQIESGNPSASLDKIHGEIMKIVNAEIEAGRGGRTFMDTLKNSGFHQIAAQMAGMFGVYDVINLGKELASTVIDINTQITELAKVSEQSSKQIYADFDSYADIAKEVRGTISDTIAATADWSKNGYSIPDAKQLAEVSQLYKNVGDGINIDEANESLISTLKGFQLEADQAEHIVDVFNEVSKNIGEVA